MALTRARQFALKLQTGEGALATLAAANASVNAKDVSYSLSLGDFERKFDIGSLTRQSFMKGPALLKIKGVFECVGGTAGAKGVWHECLEAAGFLHTAVVSQTFLALTSGTPPAAGTLIGDNATQGSATKLARILKYYDSGGTKKIWYYMIIGVAFTAAETIYGYDGGVAVIDPNAASAAAGHVFTPVTETESYVPPCATAQVAIGGEYVLGGDGRGTCKFMVNHGEPISFESEITLLPVFESDGAGGLRLTQGDPIEDVVSPGVPARVAKGLSPFLLDAYSPVATQMDIDMGITVTPRKTIGVGEGDIPDVGYLAPRITDRKVSASFDPEQPPLATFNFTRRMINASLHKFQVEAGRVGDTQGIVGIIGPTVQLNGDATAGDRDGIVIRNPSLDFVGTQDDEIIVYHIF